MSKLKCINISKQAWNDEKVTLESDDTTVIIHIKDPESHGEFQEGNEYSIAFDEHVKKAKKAKK